MSMKIGYLILVETAIHNLGITLNLQLFIEKLWINTYATPTGRIVFDTDGDITAYYLSDHLDD